MRATRRLSTSATSAKLGFAHPPKRELPRARIGRFPKSLDSSPLGTCETLAKSPPQEWTIHRKDRNHLFMEYLNKAVARVGVTPWNNVLRNPPLMSQEAATASKSNKQKTVLMEDLDVESFFDLEADTSKNVGMKSKLYCVDAAIGAGKQTSVPVRAISDDPYAADQMARAILRACPNKHPYYEHSPRIAIVHFSQKSSDFETPIVAVGTPSKNVQQEFSVIARGDVDFVQLAKGIESACERLQSETFEFVRNASMTKNGSLDRQKGEDSFFVRKSDGVVVKALFEDFSTSL